MSSVKQQRLRLSGGSELSFVTAGAPSSPALLLLHGFPSSSRTFREVIPGLAQTAYVIAPDLPGHGRSDPLPAPSFAAFGAAITELLDHLAIKQRFIYLHDFGAPVGLQIAMQSPEQVCGLIIQNANAHRSGFGPQWQATLAYWHRPSPENEAAATTHLTFAGVRDQYTAGVPEDVTARIKGEPWVEDWEVMRLPGRMETQRALVADYANHVARFDAIADYLALWQPPALMLWGRHDAFFDLAETLSWMQALPRMEAHIFDAGHFLLETHAEAALALMASFLKRGARV
jgi:pimeloyl-ACP methyl ester carboxylesterase